MITALREKFDDSVVTILSHTAEDGSSVTLLDGPFKGSEAIVVGVPDRKERIKVLLEFLGKEM